MVFPSVSWYTSVSSVIVSRGFLIVIAFNLRLRNCRENLAIINEIDFNVVFGLEFFIR